MSKHLKCFTNGTMTSDSLDNRHDYWHYERVYAVVGDTGLTES